MSRSVLLHGRARWSALSVLAVITVAVGVSSLAGGASGATAQVGLGAATNFAVLAGSGTTNTGSTTITGDIGTFPKTTMVGLALITLHGTNDAGDARTQSAKGALVTAYNDAASRGPRSAVAANLGGRTLVAGVYHSASSLGLTGVLTLNGQGNPYSVFVFQAGSTLTTASGSAVRLINGARACNVFWQVGSSATLGTNSTFRGTILALTSITLTTGATVDGRTLARNGAVTMDRNTITRSLCGSSVGASPSATPSQIVTPPKGGVGTGS